MRSREWCFQGDGSLFALRGRRPRAPRRVLARAAPAKGWGPAAFPSPGPPGAGARLKDHNLRAAQPFPLRGRSFVGFRGPPLEFPLRSYRLIKPALPL